jgi:hypothetical protein
MKLKALAGLICVTGLLGLPAASQAASPIETTIYFEAAVPAGGTFVDFVGRLGASNKQCITGRTVKIFFFYNNVTTPPTLVDTDVTSANGVWAGRGDGTGLVAIRFSATRKDFGPRKHRRTCPSTHVLAYL